jgi:hypothetical protein
LVDEGDSIVGEATDSLEERLVFFVSFFAVLHIPISITSVCLLPAQLFSAAWKAPAAQF